MKTGIHKIQMKFSVGMKKFQNLVISVKENRKKKQKTRLLKHL